MKLTLDLPKDDSPPPTTSPTAIQTARDTTSPCRQTICFNYTVDTYIFIDPGYINKFTPEFKKSDEYENFITNLAHALDKP